MKYGNNVSDTAGYLNSFVGSSENLFTLMNLKEFDPDSIFYYHAYTCLLILITVRVCCELLFIIIGLFYINNNIFYSYVSL